MLYLKNATIYTEAGVYQRAGILLENGKVKQIFPERTTPFLETKGIRMIDVQEMNVIPGFIDTHIHGTNGADVMDATPESLSQMATSLPQEGTTAFLATTITQSVAAISAAVENVARFSNVRGQAEIIGIHLEGPFIHPSKAGAQPVEYIQSPDYALFEKWQQLAGGKIKVITLAPEQDREGTFIKAITNAGVVISAGHTTANFATMKQATLYGVQQLTHLGNAMTGIHHRDVGAVGAAFLIPELVAEVIADQIHLSHEMLEIIYRQLGSERIMLITDSMRAKGLPPGTYELGGQSVTVRADQAVLADGTLASSVLTMQQAAQHMLSLPGVTLSDIIQMTAVLPAKQAGVADRKGSIAPGKDADLLVVDHELNISYTICRGELAWQHPSSH